MANGQLVTNGDYGPQAFKKYKDKKRNKSSL